MRPRIGIAGESRETSGVEGTPDAARREQRVTAAERFRERRDERLRNIEVIREPGGLAAANPPERIALRADRVSRFIAGEPLPDAEPDVAEGDAEELMTEAVARAADAGLEEPPREAPSLERAEVVLERIIGTPDFVAIRYLEAGTAAARAVGRVTIRDSSGRRVGYGTGSMISPRLLLTNHHVLSSSAAAAASSIEFNYQDGIDGRPLEPRVFSFDPDTFFLADRTRDFALVAVSGSEAELADFGFNPLVAAAGTALVGESVAIVQHPRGEKKQVALRENEVVDLPGNFLHYETDTEPGSSGSPVFNDQWEMIALHHASVPVRDDSELREYLNEGIRAAPILAFIERARLTGPARALAEQVTKRQPVRVAPTPRRGTTPAPETPPRRGTRLQSVAARPARVTVPLELTLTVESGPAEPPDTTPAPDDEEPSDEAVRIDPDYGTRTGYDNEFLGTGELRVPLPRLPEALRNDVAMNRSATSAPAYVLPYHHFSVVMNRRRRLAFFTAVNIDGHSGRRIKREADRWSRDPRIGEDEQTGEEVYSLNPLDRGHLVRRLDPAWGASYDAAKLANDDTFHFTNCTPQHEDFNQESTTWAGLEDYILENAQTRGFRVSVFTGPVLAPGDDEYRGVQLPREFWKIAVIAKDPGVLSATAYLLSQEQLLDGLEADADFSYGAYRTFQVPVATIESLTRLDFGALSDFDPLASREAAVAAHEVAGPGDLVL